MRCDDLKARWASEKASVTLCNVCAESLNLTGRSLVKKVLMLLVREENGLFGSLGT